MIYAAYGWTGASFLGDGFGLIALIVWGLTRRVTRFGRVHGNSDASDPGRVLTLGWGPDQTIADIG